MLQDSYLMAGIFYEYFRAQYYHLLYQGYKLRYVMLSVYSGFLSSNLLRRIGHLIVGQFGFVAFPTGYGPHESSQNKISYNYWWSKTEMSITSWESIFIYNSVPICPLFRYFSFFICLYGSKLLFLDQILNFWGLNLWFFYHKDELAI